jgi:hypothetical protein
MQGRTLFPKLADDAAFAEQRGDQDHYDRGSHLALPPHRIDEGTAGLFLAATAHDPLISGLAFAHNQPRTCSATARRRSSLTFSRWVGVRDVRADVAYDVVWWLPCWVAG